MVVWLGLEMMMIIVPIMPMTMAIWWIGIRVQATAISNMPKPVPTKRVLR